MAPCTDDLFLEQPFGQTPRQPCLNPLKIRHPPLKAFCSHKTHFIKMLEDSTEQTGIDGKGQKCPNEDLHDHFLGRSKTVRPTEDYCVIWTMPEKQETEVFFKLEQNFKAKVQRSFNDVLLFFRG